MEADHWRVYSLVELVRCADHAEDVPLMEERWDLCGIEICGSQLTFGGRAVLPRWKENVE